MAFKLNNQECENILRGKQDGIHEKELKRLKTLLETADTQREVNLLQGRIKQQRLIMELPEKAANQLHR